MWQFFTERGKKVVQLAHREALRLGHDVIGTEHLLLGILAEGEGVAFQSLETLGVDTKSLWKVLTDPQRGSPHAPGGPHNPHISGHPCHDHTTPKRR